MSREYGVWSTSEDGYVSTGAWSPEEAERDRQAEIAAAAPEDRAEAAEDLRARAICSEHAEQPADACEECAADEDDDQDDEEE